MGAALVFILTAAAMLALLLRPGAVLPPTRVSTLGNGQGRFAVRGARGQEDGTGDPGVAQVPLLLDLLGTALESGMPLSGALHVVSRVAAAEIGGPLLRVAAGLDIGASWQDSWEGNTGSRELARIHASLSFAALTGAGAAPLLYAEAAQIRSAAAREAEKRAAALGVKLVLPLGLCSLPAFVALGIVPVVIAMVPTF